MKDPREPGQRTLPSAEDASDLAPARVSADAAEPRPRLEVRGPDGQPAADPPEHRTLFVADRRDLAKRPAAPGGGVRKADAPSDVVRARALWIGGAAAAVGVCIAAVAAPTHEGGEASPGPLTPPHVAAKLTCASCHGKAEAGTPAYTKDAKSACVGCHGPHPSTREGHRRLASDGELGCVSCHTIHGPQSGVHLPEEGGAVRYGTRGQIPLEGLGFNAGRDLYVPTIPIQACLGCHTTDAKDPLARCRSHAIEGPLEPTVCFDEHRPTLPAEATPAAVRDPRNPRGSRDARPDSRGSRAKPPAASKPDKKGVCADQHLEDRSFAWDVAREGASRVPVVQASVAGGGTGAWLAAGGILGALGYAGTLAYARFSRKRRSVATATAPAVAPAARKRLPVIDTTTCLGCYACVDACPYGVLEVESYVAVVARPDACCGLVLCEQRCPNGSLAIWDGEPIEDRPRIGDKLESADVAGVFLAGDVTGLPLIKNAIHQGARSAETAHAALASRPRGDGAVDVCVVGAGPAGISASLRLKELGASHVVLEQGTVAQSIQSFPRGKLVFEQPLDLPVSGKLWLKESSKEELLLQWTRIVRRQALPIREHVRMTSIERRADGLFAVEAVSVDGTQSRTLARSVILAIGQRGSPRALSVPVPPEAESRVFYHLADARSLAGQKVVIAGLGDTAMEAAVALAGQPRTSVTIVHRGATYSRGQSRNIAELERLRRAGRLHIRYGCEVAEVGVGHLVLRATGAAASKTHERVPYDALFVLIGSIPPWDTLARAGIRRPRSPAAGAGVTE